ncbi:MAG: diadenylate cyclase CdaA [Anaerolineae bacterium]|nr:diadenylate cyclase CdaA [Anaerolineae bacterium]
MWDLSWLLQRLSWADILDISMVAVLFFWLFYAIRGTRAVPLVRGITALLVSLALLSRVVKLRAFSWMIEQLLPALLVAIPVLFQPELRRAFEQLGRGRLSLVSEQGSERVAHAIEAVVAAATQMAARGVGALIVFERHTGLQEYVETGVHIDGDVTPELLTTIFDHHTVLHDGAVIITEGRLVAAACVLPLTAAFLEDRELGLRHRAALGITEDTDAVAVVISEERSAVSLTHNGRMIRNIDAKRLTSILRAFLLPRPRRVTPRLFRWLRLKRAQDQSQS